MLSWFTPTITAKAAVEKIRNMTHDEKCGITLALERVRSVQPLAFIWAHFLRLYLTCCSLRYGVSSARIRIGFPADILQETVVHQSRGKEKKGGEGGTRRRHDKETVVEDGKCKIGITFGWLMLKCAQLVLNRSLHGYLFPARRL